MRNISMIAVAMLGMPAVSSASPGPDDLTRLPLEDLLALEATSVAKKRQSVADAAAAVFIISQEDIRRSTARTIPDLLRMVPGVEVGSIDGNSVAISMRGFNTRFANSVLVLINGRTAYVSALSGVLWDQLLEPLETIERIEVVRGPGATIWGANAVNGIINIITKNSFQTQGALAQARIGGDGGNALLRFGGGGERLTYRINGFARRMLNPALRADGTTATVETLGAQLGGQVDIAASADDSITVRATGAAGSFGPRDDTLRNRALTVGRYAEGNLLGRWARRVGDDADFTLQAYLDRLERHESGIMIGETLLDVEANARRAIGRIEIGAGLNYRLTTSRFKSDEPRLSFLTDHSRDELFSSYVQADHWLVPTRLRLTLGTKIERSSITGWAIQPSARLLWRPDEKASAWTSWSRAARTASLFERQAVVQVEAGPGGEFASPIPVSVHATGSPDLKSARLDALEAGIRLNPTGWLMIDVAAYHNRYRRLVGYGPIAMTITATSGGPALGAEYRVLNNSRSTSTGVEAAMTLMLSPALKLDASCSRIRSRFDVLPVAESLSFPGLPPGLNYSLPLLPQPGLVTTPSSQAALRLRWDATPWLELDGGLRHVAALKLVSVPAYAALDLRIGVRLDPATTLSLIGQNLLEARRLEFRESLISAAPGLVARRFAVDLQKRF